MNRIDAIFNDLRASGSKGVMPFVCGQHPAPGATAQVLPVLEAAGASIVEVGIPFSDPIADGPVIAAAMYEALRAGSTPTKTLAEIRQARDAGLSIGVVAMVSVSLVERAGPKQFVASCVDAGVDGFIFPDAPLEEADHLIRIAADAGATASLLIAPTTPIDRAARIAEASTGFVYVLARSGITGERDDAPDVSERVAALRQVTDLPIACGFGISTQAQVAEVVRHADAAIVGSALVRRMTEAAAQGGSPADAAQLFVQELAGALPQTAPRD